MTIVSIDIINGNIGQLRNAAFLIIDRLVMNIVKGGENYDFGIGINIFSLYFLKCISHNFFTQRILHMPSLDNPLYATLIIELQRMFHVFRVDSALNVLN